MAYVEDPWRFGNIVTFDVDGSFGARMIFYSFVHEFVTDNVVAAGATQGTATLLAGGGRHRIITTPVGSGVILTPNANISGLKMFVLNHGANALNVYPQVGGSINTIANVNLGVNIPFVVAVGTSTTFVSLGATSWQEWA